MADGQRIIPDETVGQDFLITGLGLPGFGEEVGKVAADELFARHTGHEFGCVVDIGDFARRTDGDQRIQTRFEQAPRIKRRPAQFGGALGHAPLQLLAVPRFILPQRLLGARMSLPQPQGGDAISEVIGEFGQQFDFIFRKRLRRSRVDGDRAERFAGSLEGDNDG